MPDSPNTTPTEDPASAMDELRAYIVQTAAEHAEMKAALAQHTGELSAKQEQIDQLNAEVVRLTEQLDALKAQVEQGGGGTLPPAAPSSDFTAAIAFRLEDISETTRQELLRLSREKVQGLT